MSIFGPFHRFLNNEAFDTVLLELEISQNGHVHLGQGRFICDLAGLQSFWGITQCSETKMNSTIESLQIGAMIPDKWHLSLKAKNRAGHSISADRMFDQGGEIGTRPRVWNYHSPVATTLEIKYQATPGTSLSIQSICDAPHLRECFRFWIPNDSEIDFPIRVEGLFGKLQVHFLNEGRILLNCEPNDSIDLDRCMDAATLAIGFASGRPVNELVRKISKPDAVTERIVCTGSKVNTSLWTPFGSKLQQQQFSPQFWELLIAKSSDYFLFSDDSHTNPQLTALWNSVDRSFSVSSLIACSVLEGLCNQSKEQVPTVLTKLQLQMIDKLVESAAFVKAGVGDEIERNRDSISTRISNALAPLNSKNATNLLTMWCESGKYGLSMAVLVGRKSLRNKPAHGHFDLFDVESVERAKLVAHRNAVYQGINSILLSRMGYEGPYFDWITGSIKERHIGHATPSIDRE